MSTGDDKRRAHAVLVARVLEGDGRASKALRRDAFDGTGLDGPLATLIERVAADPTRITDADVAAVRAAGLSEDEVFELVVCAAVGEATRQYESALGALGEAAGGGERG